MAKKRFQLQTDIQTGEHEERKQALEDVGIKIWTLNDIKDKEYIGAGAYGKVELLSMKSDETSKRVLKTMRDDQEFFKRFIKEIKVLAALQHPNIVPLLGAISKPLGLMLEYVAFSFELYGIDHVVTNLRGFLNKIHEFSAVGTFHEENDIIRFIAKETVEGLSYLHKNNIAHRDLKPSNILVGNTKNGVVDENIIMECKIADFGEARSQSIQTSMAVASRTSNVDRGTVPFQAPEAILGYLKTANLSNLKMMDVWAYGCILFCLLNPDLEYPFEKEFKANTNISKDLRGCIAALLKKRRLPEHTETYSDLRDMLKDTDTLMVKCMSFVPPNRPTFDDIREWFKAARHAEHLSVGTGTADPTRSFAVVVTDIPKDIDADFLELWFESEHRSGGGVIDELYCEELSTKNCVTITYQSVEVAERVVETPQRPKGIHVNVELLTAESIVAQFDDCMDDRMVLITNMPAGSSIPDFQMFFQRHVNYSVESVVCGKNQSKALVKFQCPIDFMKITRFLHLRPYRGRLLSLQQVAKSKAIQVNGVKGLDPELVYFYFQSGKSGGGRIVKYDPHPDEDYALIYFETSEVFHAVLQEKHILKERPLRVSILYECLGVLESIPHDGLSSNKCDYSLRVHPKGSVLDTMNNRLLQEPKLEVADFKDDQASHEYSHAIVVTDIPSDMDRDYLMLWFESERRSGGGLMEDFFCDDYMKSNSVTITYKSNEVARRVKSLTQRPKGNKLSVALIPPAVHVPCLVDDRKLLVRNSPPGTKDSNLRDFFLRLVNNPIEHIERYEDLSKILLIFRLPIDFVKTIEQTSIRPFRGRMLSFQQVPMSKEFNVEELQGQAEIQRGQSNEWIGRRFDSKIVHDTQSDIVYECSEILDMADREIIGKPPMLVASKPNSNTTCNRSEVAMEHDTALLPTSNHSNELYSPEQKQNLPYNDLSNNTYNGARPKNPPTHTPLKKRVRQLKNGFFVTDYYIWLWYKNKYHTYHGETTEKYYCEIKEKPVEAHPERIEVTAISAKRVTDEGQQDTEKCVKDIKGKLEHIQEHFNIVGRQVQLNLTYTYELAKKNSCADSYICDDSNGGLIIVGLNEEAVQSVFERLEREYGPMSNDISSHSVELTSKPDVDDSESNRCIDHITDSEWVEGLNSVTGIYTKIVQTNYRTCAYLEMFRNKDLAYICDKTNIKLMKRNEGKRIHLNLKGGEDNITYASAELALLLTDIDEVIHEIQIHDSSLPGTKLEILKVIESLQHKYTFVLFNINGDLIQIIGALEHIHAAKGELQCELTKIHRGSAIDIPGSKNKKGKRERRLLHYAVNQNVSTYETEAGLKIHVFKGDITQLRVGGVVNAANCYLKHGGGVAGAISKAAGPELQAECDRYIEQNGIVPTAGLYTSKPYNISCLNIIHVVGPRWSDYSDKMLAQTNLRHCFLAVLAEADRLNLPSIAIPAVGSGIYGSPLPIVAQLMFDGVNNFACGSFGNTTVRDIILVDNNTEVLDLLNRHYQQAVQQGTLKKVPAKFEHFSKCDTRTCFIRPDEPGQEATERFTTAYEAQATFDGKEEPKASDQIPILGSVYNKGVEMFKNIWSPQISPDRFTSYAGSSSASGSETMSSQQYLPHYETRMKAYNEPAPKIRLRESLTPSLYNPVEYSQLAVTSVATHNNSSEDTESNCAICMETPTNKQVLPLCNHVFCKDCIETWFKIKPACPKCGQFQGEMKGDQPDGSMNINRQSYKLEGFDNSRGTIAINYNFPGGVQQECHPNPGSRYHGTRRIAYLPDNEEGNHVLGLLRRAFDAKLVFTIGRSTTTGRDDQITWNDIHHKTNVSGGPDRSGYPDATYLSRAKEELAAKGIK